MGCMGFTARGNREVNEGAPILIDHGGKICVVITDGLGGQAEAGMRCKCAPIGLTGGIGDYANAL